MTVLSSGNDVEKASNTAPTKLRPKPVCTAIASAVRLRKKPAARMTIAAATVLAITGLSAPPFRSADGSCLVSFCSAASGFAPCAIHGWRPVEFEIIHIEKMYSARRAHDQAPMLNTGVSPIDTAAATTIRTSVPKAACSSSTGEAAITVSASRPMNPSTPASIALCIAIPPRRLFTASVGFSAMAEKIEMATSGNEVTPPSSTRPTATCPMPVLTAIVSA